ncbi:MAG: hypothetical protein F4X02_09805 [Chloroflexi bacterium]|nr:hypothetical protein [Chloroflexota bacterium]
MAQTAPQYDADPKPFPSLSPDEQRIANAVVAALQSELKPIRETQEQHSKILEQHSKILEQHSELLANIQPILDTQEQHTKLLVNIQQELRDINKILAAEGFIPDNPDY